MSSKVFNWHSISLPESVVAGQSFILAVEVTVKEALYDNNNRVMLDSADNVILPADGEYISGYTGDNIDNLISEVLT